jgi:hypothetical protein
MFGMSLVRRVGLVGVTAVFLGMTLSSGLASAAAGKTIHASLEGASVVPGAGDPNGVSAFSMTMRPHKASACWELSFSSISALTGAAIYESQPGGGGVFAYNLGFIAIYPPPTGDQSGAISGCESRSGPGSAEFTALLKALVRHPGRYFVQIDTTEYPDGALRGTLHH